MTLSYSRRLTRLLVAGGLVILLALLFIGALMERARDLQLQAIEQVKRTARVLELVNELQNNLNSPTRDEYLAEIETLTADNAAQQDDVEVLRELFNQSTVTPSILARVRVMRGREIRALEQRIEFWEGQAKRGFRFRQSLFWFTSFVLCLAGIFIWRLLKGRQSEDEAWISEQLAAAESVVSDIQGMKLNTGQAQWTALDETQRKAREIIARLTKKR